MEYGRLGKPDPLGFSNRSQTAESTPALKKPKIKLLLIVAAILMVASAVSAALVVVLRNKASSDRLQRRRPSQAMSRTCGRTLYPKLCVNSLLDFPGALTASDKDLVHISVNMTLQKVGRSLYSASEITNLDMDPHARIKDLSEHVSNSLAIYAAGGGGDDFSDIPIQNRRLLSEEEKFPAWLSRRERMLLDMPVSAINAGDIYGTVDFIFGNAAVVFQNCVIHARKPMAQQKNTITAQNRKDPNQNTGISIHACRVGAEPELEAVKGQYPTYLGRPWKLYSRTVYLLSNLGDHIHHKGWLEWNGEFALDTLYYGEYMNSGPGAGLGQRVKWPGYRVIKPSEEAEKFTVTKFIYGASWLPSTGVAFLGGLQT